MFVAAVNADASRYWRRVFKNANVPFSAALQEIVTRSSADECEQSGSISSRDPAAYCPDTKTVYLTVDWFDEQARPLGDGAVLAAVALLQGFHTFDLVGGNEKIENDDLPSKANPIYSACFAGAYIATVGTRDLLEKGDIREALDLVGKLGGGSGYAAPSEAELKDGFVQGINDGPGSCFEIDL